MSDVVAVKDDGLRVLLEEARVAVLKALVLAEDPADRKAVVVTIAKALASQLPYQDEWR